MRSSITFLGESVNLNTLRSVVLQKGYIPPPFELENIHTISENSSCNEPNSACQCDGMHFSNHTGDDPIARLIYICPPGSLGRHTQTGKFVCTFV